MSDEAKEKIHEWTVRIAFALGSALLSVCTMYVTQYVGFLQGSVTQEEVDARIADAMAKSPYQHDKELMMTKLDIVTERLNELVRGREEDRKVANDTATRVTKIEANLNRMP